MRYLFNAGRGVNRRVMHIAEHNVTGDMTGYALCKIGNSFNRSINAPFGLGRPVCKKCRRALALCDAHKEEDDEI